AAGTLTVACRSTTDAEGPSSQPSSSSTSASESAAHPPPQAAPGSEQISLDELRELIQQGSLHPVSETSAGDPFADPKPDTPEQEFDAQAKRVTEKIGDKEQVAPT